MCICVYVYMCICVYVYIYVYMCICVYVYMCICVYVYMCICVYIYPSGKFSRFNHKNTLQTQHKQHSFKHLDHQSIIIIINTFIQDSPAKHSAH